MTDLIDRLKRLGPVRVRSHRQLVQELWDSEQRAGELEAALRKLTEDRKARKARA